MPVALSEALLRDLRVIDARVVCLDIAEGRAARFGQTRRAMLHFVLDGTATITSSDGSTARLGKGDAAMLIYGDRHVIGDGADGATLVEMSLDGGDALAEEPATIRLGDGRVGVSLMSAALDFAYMSPAAAAIRAAPDLWAMRAVLSLDTALIAASLRGPGAKAFATALGNLLVVQGLREITDRYWRDTEIEVRAPGTRRIAAAVQLLHAHPDQRWTLPKIAQSVGLSRSSFAEAFTAQIGMPPGTYLSRLRLERAAQLLSSGAIPIAEVARRAGYAVPSSFVRAFTRQHGMSPKRYMSAAQGH